ncbi:MAG: hypothetical protein ACI9YE_002979 [Psychroserpens sp.]|jgi:hypothetical protein
MINKNFTLTKITILLCLLIGATSIAQVGIGTATPDASSILEVYSTSKGILIPRLTLTERDAITTPAESLVIYNTTSNTFEVFVDAAWKALSYEKSPNAYLSNLVYVYSIDDLPAPVSNEITLDATKMYVFSGIVDISPNFITMNGAGLRGTDPQKDGIMSTVSGAILRSVDTSVFIQDFSVRIPTAGTKAYDFSDATQTKFCNLFSGCSVVEYVPSLGVGNVSGFEAATFVKNYWKVSDGIKVGGNFGKFASTLNFITGISAGSGIELLSTLNADDIDLANNYFDYVGQTGLKVNAGASIDRARLTSNMFRGLTTPLDGVTSYTPGWSMQQNTNIPNSRAAGSIYMNNNATPTTLTALNTFYKIAGTTTAVNEQRFTAGNNRLTYTSVDPIVAKVSVIIGAKARSNNAEYSIGIVKNDDGTVIPVPDPVPIASMASTVNNQSFQITLITEMNLVTGDFIEVFVASSTSGAITVAELQFRVTD